LYQSQLENPLVEIPQTKDVTFIQLGDGNQYETTVKGKPYIVIEKNLEQAIYANHVDKWHSRDLLLFYEQLKKQHNQRFVVARSVFCDAAIQVFVFNYL